MQMMAKLALPTYIRHICQQQKIKSFDRAQRIRQILTPRHGDNEFCWVVRGAIFSRHLKVFFPCASATSTQQARVWGHLQKFCTCSQSCNLGRYEWNSIAQNDSLINDLTCTSGRRVWLGNASVAFAMVRWERYLLIIIIWDFSSLDKLFHRWERQ